MTRARRLEIGLDLLIVAGLAVFAGRIWGSCAV